MGQSTRLRHGLPLDDQDTLPSGCSWCAGEVLPAHVLVAEGRIYGASCDGHLLDSGRLLRYVVLQSRAWAMWAGPDELERIGGAWLVMPLVGVAVD